ncbi:MAG TPA: hypothetical protein VFL90_17745 [Methylomirabilota bacterium]|nr:hypothetical protein [Methylomirabilota bacterium]
MKTPSQRPLDLAGPRRRLKSSPAVSLWRPEIVLATSIAAPACRPVVLAEPGVRPDALRAQLGTARAALTRLGDARQTFGAVAAQARARVEEATTSRERVSATFAAYRAEAALDDALTGAWRQMSALMEERGLR